MAGLLRIAEAGDAAGLRPFNESEMERLMRKVLMTLGLLGIASVPAHAQLGGRITVEPYVGYGFFGELPETSASLEADLVYGGRVGYRFAPQWGVFGNFQRSTPDVTGPLGVGLAEINVDQWSAGVEFSYVPRGGAEGMLPILLEAGLGQTRYEAGTNDLAVNVGLASALQLTPNVAIRYGANDYISNYRGDRGIVNQITVRVGVELGM